MSNIVDFSTLTGKIFTKVYQDTDDCNSDELHFECSNGEHYKLFHYQDCCEDVRIEDICGDLENLLNTPILLAEESSDSSESSDDESYTWTYYKLRTIKGSVDIRWYGSSNGYYSERVDLVKVET